MTETEPLTLPPIPSAAADQLNRMMGVIWLDLETTGLEHRNGRILEIAVQPASIVNPLAFEDDLSAAVVRHPIGDVLADCDDYVKRMHTTNGLFEAVKGATLTLEDIDAELYETFRPSEADRAKGRKWVLAGNSVGSFDLQWVREHMPKFATVLSHRVFDVSTLILFAEMLGWDPGRTEPAHRSGEDVIQSQLTTRRVFEYVLNLKS